MNRKDLYCALSDISETFISEANEVREGNSSTVAAAQKRRRITFVSGAMAAACACVCALTLAIVLPLQNNTTVGDIPNNSSPSTSEPNIGDGDNNASGAHNPGDGNVGGSAGGSHVQRPLNCVGSVVAVSNNSIRFASLTESRAVFEYTFTEDIAHELGFIVTFCRKTESKQDTVCSISTNDNYKFGGQLLSTELLKLTVNGEIWLQNKIPDTIGHYEVVFDYSSVLDMYDDIYAESIMLITTIEEGHPWFIVGFDLTEGVIFG